MDLTAPWLLNHVAVECRNKFWWDDILLNGLDVTNMKNDDIEDGHLLDIWPFVHLIDEPLVQPIVAPTTATCAVN
jgi:hypothetical protein